METATTSANTSRTENDGNDDNDKEQVVVTKKPSVAKRRGIQIASDSSDDSDEESLQIDESYKSPLKERKSTSTSNHNNTNENSDHFGSIGKATGTKRRMLDSDSDDDDDEEQAGGEEEKENKPKKARVEERISQDELEITKNKTNEAEVRFLFVLFRLTL